MGSFRRQLNAHTARLDVERKRRWLFVPYDQLSDRIGPLADLDAGDVGIVVVEAPAKAAKRPYHQQKLALVLTNLRHFALEQAARGVAVRHVVSAGDYAAALRPLAAELGPLTMMRAAERELREDVADLVDEGAVVVVDHDGWLTTAGDFAAACPAPPYRMDAFYRHVRRRTWLLMERNGKPVGGRFSFDGENRQPWRGTPPTPTPPSFVVDDVTAEVVDLVRRQFAQHPGTLTPSSLPASAADAASSWAWALSSCLPSFGPFEDAMSTRSSGLFHTRVSGLLNLHRLLPRDVVDDVVAADVPLPSKEGFVRQVLGWREFVRHVHVASDGFRRGPGSAPNAAPSTLSAHAPLPAAYWPASWGGEKSGLACLDHVVDDVWREGYSHHITRLMVLSNIATLLDVEPRALTDWFWAAYVDAYDWVVEPNVLAMGTYGAGDLMTTKPYVAGAAYVDKMGDFCGGCAFSPRDGSCPLTSLYWAFLERHRDVLDDNDRMKLIMASSRRRTAEQKTHDARIFQIASKTLASKSTLSPSTFSPPSPPSFSLEPSSSPSPQARAGSAGTSRSSGPRSRSKRSSSST